MLGMQRMTRNWMPLPLNVVRWSALSINRCPSFASWSFQHDHQCPARSLLPLWALRPHPPYAYRTLAVVVPLLLVVLVLSVCILAHRQLTTIEVGPGLNTFLFFLPSPLLPLFSPLWPPRPLESKVIRIPIASNNRSTVGHNFACSGDIH